MKNEIKWKNLHLQPPLCRLGKGSAREKPWGGGGELLSGVGEQNKGRNFPPGLPRFPKEMRPGDFLWEEREGDQQGGRRVIPEGEEARRIPSRALS